MDAVLIIAVVLLGGSFLFIVAAIISKPFRNKKQNELPENITMTVQGSNVSVPIPSSDKLSSWYERKQANENNPTSCEGMPGEGELLVPVSFFAPGCGLAGWPKSETYWEAVNRTSWEGYNNIVMSVADYEEANEYIANAKRQEERLTVTLELNNRGIELEKAGEIAAAISIYEECIKLRYPATHAYYRLMVLYRKAKDVANEERVIRVAIDVFPNEGKYKERLTRLLSRVTK